MPFFPLPQQQREVLSFVFRTNLLPTLEGILHRLNLIHYIYLGSIWRRYHSERCVSRV